ncbi:MAG TPA: YbaB/EbfC family nucleoid-associated protein [Halanaerobiaceae bacterium]|jgi:DNA-binding protein YbaB|nr:YbaB/EbfC family nucleoid-associated protein [Bacillota bacterium]HHU91845.1 YbaB/EbfC family nucleoid-associated protein [Halanaerobiaceae bacterium]HOA41408.1 YbaB/EbfC family nucleoid-associated protein [Halanaerobiales bacterium]HPZ63528.1 YbaB/EbfC family nucleoid-associated protein [Halanaerobiales bacterium]HQD04768.1 YbaB/EbfC family nucleoid-associated protein [Halanaerobiales bacterium]
MDISNIITQINNIKNGLAALEKELEEITVEGSDSQGMITAIVNGKGIVQNYLFNPGQISSIKKDNLIQALIEASNQALTKARELAASKKKEILAEVNIPDIPGLF